jgi:glycosyltransferase involved in cell wall biosynthesis
MIASRSTRRSVGVVVTRLQAGAGGVALRGALAVDPSDYQVTIFAGAASGTADADGSGDTLADRAVGAGLRVVHVPELVPNIAPGTEPRALRILTEHLADGHYDVVHTHSAKAGALGRLAAMRAGVPRIVHTLHGFPFHEFQSAPRRAGYVAVERYLGQHTDVFLAIGGGVAAEAVRRGIAPPDRIRVIDPAIERTDRPVGPAARAAARRRLAAPVGCRLVGTVGRVDYQKAPECFVDAVAALDRDDVHAVWIGDGPLRGKMEARARRRGLADRFACLGHRDDVAELLPGLDVFAMASRYEGLPCAIAEAMSAGVPVVATAVNAVPDLVVAGETGLLVGPQRPQELATAIAHLLDHPAAAARMTERAGRLLAGRFAPEVLGALLDEVYAGAPRRLTPDRSPAAVRSA